MIEEFNTVLQYVEENLTNNINMEKISNITKLSAYNFQKIFTILTGISFGDYVRRRRLSTAMLDLCETEETIIYISGKYGYESPDSFTRSFKQYFGETPSYIRRTKSKLKTFPKFVISLDIAGGIEMEYKIVNKKSLNVMGIKASFESVEQGHKKIGNLWSEFNTSHHDEKLYNLCTLDLDLKGTLGLCISDSKTEAFDYIIGVVTDAAIESDAYVVQNVPAKKYLVFQVEIKDKNVPKSIQNAYRTIFSTILPSTEYKFNGSDFEFYPYTTNDETWTPQIWIPVD